MQETARGSSLFEEAASVFEIDDLNVEWYMKLVAIQCYQVI